jgi:hypothetical protein
MPHRLDDRDDVVRGFADACQRGDLTALRAALATDAVAVCDGGGLAPAGSAHGADDAALLAATALCGRPDAELTVVSVNGRAGLALRRAGRVVAVAGVQTAGTKVGALWIVLNPAKLRHWHR